MNTLEIEKIITGKDLYSSRAIGIPTPRFIVFYNGVGEQPERKELRLSDLFLVKEGNPSLELIVTQFNINKGYNEDLGNITNF